MLRRILLFALSLVVVSVAASAQEVSTKKERNLIKEGNKYFDDREYVKALRDYDQVLESNPSNEAAQFNKAMAQFNLGSSLRDSTAMYYIQKADSTLQYLGRSATNPKIAERALYNLGNIAFMDGYYLEQQGQAQQSGPSFQKAIEYYKQVLRRNPSNAEARENLRIAQLHLPPEDQQNQDQDKQDQDKQDQDKQDQDKQDQNQDQQEQNQDQQQDQQQQQQQQQQQELKQNSEQILRTMQNKENATRRKVEEVPVGKSTTDKPW